MVQKHLKLETKGIAYKCFFLREERLISWLQFPTLRNIKRWDSNKIVTINRFSLAWLFIYPLQWAPHFTEFPENLILSCTNIITVLQIFWYVPLISLRVHWLRQFYNDISPIIKRHLWQLGPCWSCLAMKLFDGLFSARLIRYEIQFSHNIKIHSRTIISIFQPFILYTFKKICFLSEDRFLLLLHFCYLGRSNHFSIDQSCRDFIGKTGRLFIKRYKPTWHLVG